LAGRGIGRMSRVTRRARERTVPDSA
jgi:hypothetical protein